MSQENTGPLLPQELAELTIDCLQDDRRALQSCSLVSWSWNSRARSHLFQICSVGRVKRAQGMVELLASPLQTISSSIRDVQFVQNEMLEPTILAFSRARVQPVIIGIDFYWTSLHIPIPKITSLLVTSFANITSLRVRWSDPNLTFNIMRLVSAFEQLTSLELDPSKNDFAPPTGHFTYPQIGSLETLNILKLAATDDDFHEWFMQQRQQLHVRDLHLDYEERLIDPEVYLNIVHQPSVERLILCNIEGNICLSRYVSLRYLEFDIDLDGTADLVNILDTLPHSPHLKAIYTQCDGYLGAFERWEEVGIQLNNDKFDNLESFTIEYHRHHTQWAAEKLQESIEHSLRPERRKIVTVVSD